MFNESETIFNCPFCFEQISMVFESLYGAQKYIEDCEVCCQPIEVNYDVVDGSIVLNEIKRA